MTGVRAHLIKGVRHARVSDDGKYGLIGCERLKPDSNGSDEVWLGVPVPQLPMLAVAAVKAIPQPDRTKGHYPTVFDAEAVEFGVGGLGELLLTVELQKGADLSFKLTEHQARTLADGIYAALALAAQASSPPAKPN